MSHRIEVVIDEQVVDAIYYCSDACAKTDKNYEGWNGCNDVYQPETCVCGERLGWYRWNYETKNQEYVDSKDKNWGIL